MKARVFLFMTAVVLLIALVVYAVRNRLRFSNKVKQVINRLKGKHDEDGYR